MRTVPWTFWFVTSCLFVVRLALGLEWVQTSAPITNWSCVASSADGQKLAAGVDGGFIYTSTNGGLTWSWSASPSTNWACITSSADGMRLAAANPGPVYTSADAGRTWVARDETTVSFTSLASSADGSRLAAVFCSLVVEASTNYGISWTGLPAAVMPGGWSYVFVASSADGDQLLIGEGNFRAQFLMTWTNLISDFESPVDPPFATQTPIIIPGFSLMEAAAIVSSADGRRLAAVCIAGGDYPTNCSSAFFASTNAGLTWQLTCSPATNLVSLAASADGSKLIAITSGDTFYASTNAGMTWVPMTVFNANWRAVASSADGDRIVAVVYGGGIYTSQRQPKPAIEFGIMGTNLLLSWTVPSMNFSLEQNTDLASDHWTPVEAPPVLISSNIHYQVSVPAPSGQMFFRLAAAAP